MRVPPGCKQLAGLWAAGSGLWAAGSDRPQSVARGRPVANETPPKTIAKMEFRLESQLMGRHSVVAVTRLPGTRGQRGGCFE